MVDHSHVFMESLGDPSMPDPGTEKRIKMR